MSNKSHYILLFLSLLSGLTASVNAQLIVKPLQSSSNLRTSGTERDSTQLKLPFWDDFSRSDDFPDSTHWFVEDGTAFISSSVGIEPPTVNVATFDGWNNLGTPYSSLELAEGLGDSLVSRYIDLSDVNPALYETVYISFFWQKEGRGEMPDDRDSISLQLMNTDKEWVSVWGKKGEEVSDTETFTQEIIPVNNASFFHDYFQFRFQSYGRLSGGFDTWNIDYVYMNTNRSASDLYFEDRSLTTRPSSWLTQYSAMPYDHFIINLQENLAPTNVGVANLDDQVQAIEYYALIQDSTKVFDEMNEGTPLNLAPSSFSEIFSEPIDPDSFDSEADSVSLLLETKFYITSGDSANWLNKYDLRSNDTTVSTVLLEKELAYDDGTAEWAAGLSQSSGMLAYRYIIPKSDAITSLNIYFPDFIPSAIGKTFTIIIWDDLLPDRAGRLLTEQHIVQKSSRINEFTSYTLGRPVVVSDTFYIGYEQSVDDFFPVGLDKYGKVQNGNIFINLDGVWESSNKIDGNLMLRPVFGFEKAVGLEEELFRDVVLFPNPNNGTFTIIGEFEYGEVMDILGNRVLNFEGKSSEMEIRLINQKRGLYILKLVKEGRFKTFKFIID